MKARILGLLAAALLAGPMTASAGFINVVDSETKFSGAFSFQGCNVDEQYLSLFGLLPKGGEGFEGLSVLRRCILEEAILLTLATDAPGSPDNPSFVRDIDFSGESFAGVSVPLNPPGHYTNRQDAGTDPVYWRFTKLADTGGPDGTFSGAFCFSTIRGECTSGTAPEPGTLALLGLGLAGLAASRRRKR